MGSKSQHHWLSQPGTELVRWEGPGKTSGRVESLGAIGPIEAGSRRAAT